jgi:HK97 family phage prohead protease
MSGTIGQYIGPGAKRKVREAVAKIDKTAVYFPLEFKKGDDEKDDRLFFEGYANTVNLDRGGDIIRAAAWRKTIKDYLRYNPQVFYMHDWMYSIGQVTEAKVTKEGLWVRGYIQPATDDKGEELSGGIADYIRFIRGQVKRGQLRTLSVGIRILKSKAAKLKKEDGTVIEFRDITEVELFENSMVTVPANRESVVEAKAALTELHGEEVADSLIYTEEEFDLMALDEEPEEEEPSNEEQEDKDAEPDYEIVSLKDRQPEPDYEIVSLKERNQ